MLYEIGQIKRFLVRHHGLKFKPGGDAIDGGIPDGDHVIPLGASETPTKVGIRNGRIFVGGAPENWREIDAAIRSSEG